MGIWKEEDTFHRLYAFADPVMEWFLIHKRDLPWRHDVTAYRVWVSEIMLQQTRVEAVKPYYERFLQRLPNVEALAVCPEEELLKLWEGLGYYSRARNLKKGAVQVMELYGGVIPEDFNELLKLSGIGRYTAGAISSLAYGKPEPVMDGNVCRVMTRFAADPTEISSVHFRKELEEALRALLQTPKEDGTWINPSVFNQALMELGALVCVPNGAPNCLECPVCGICEAHRRSEELMYPVKAAKKARRIEDRTILRLETDSGYVVEKRPENGLLAGLYEFPNLEGRLEMDQVSEAVEEYLSRTSPQSCAEIVDIIPLPDAKHIFSHVEWRMKGYRVLLKSDNLSVVSREKLLNELAMPGALQSYMP